MHVDNPMMGVYIYFGLLFASIFVIVIIFVLENAKCNIINKLFRRLK